MAFFLVTANPLDDPFYYLNNFMQVLDWLEHRYADVLSVEEQRFIEDFNRLPRESRALLVRMVMPPNCITSRSVISPARPSRYWPWAGLMSSHRY
jgi:hypothetical protein